MKKLAIAISALSLSAAALSQSGNPSTQAEFSLESSHLSHNYLDWRAQSLRITQKPAPRAVRELTLTHTQRFGLDDQQLGGYYSTPVSDKLTATLGASISPSHRVLAKYGVEAALQYEFAPTWLAHAGLSNRRFNTTEVNQASLMLEHYFSSFSLAAAWRPVHALGVNASSAELRGGYYYGDANSIALTVSSGQEATFINPNTVVLADVRTTALVGRHQLNPQWALRYSFASTRQGLFYNLKSIRLGAEYVF